jgi:hypothetical protein
MSRAQQSTIDRLQAELAGVREQLAEAKGEARGERRGEYRVANQLAADLGEIAVRADRSDQAAKRAVADVRSLLRLVAEYVNDMTATGADPTAATRVLLDQCAEHGFPLSRELLQVRLQRAIDADNDARVSAAEAAAAVTSAPGPGTPSA